MNQTEREETTRAVEQFLNESLERILLSNPVNPQQLSRARLRPRGSPPCPITGRSGIFWRKGLRCRFWSIWA